MTPTEVLNAALWLLWIIPTVYITAPYAVALALGGHLERHAQADPAPAARHAAPRPDRGHALLTLGRSAQGRRTDGDRLRAGDEARSRGDGTGPENDPAQARLVQREALANPAPFKRARGTHRARRSKVRAEDRRMAAPLRRKVGAAVVRLLRGALSLFHPTDIGAVRVPPGRGATRQIVVNKGVLFATSPAYYLNKRGTNYAEAVDLARAERQRLDEIRRAEQAEILEQTRASMFPLTVWRRPKIDPVKLAGLEARAYVRGAFAELMNGHDLGEVTRRATRVIAERHRFGYTHDEATSIADAYLQGWVKRPRRPSLNAEPAGLPEWSEHDA